MAQSRDGAAAVEQWVQTTQFLIEEAGRYSQGGQYDAETDGLIRKVRVHGAALSAALNSIQFPLNIPPPPPPPPPPPEGATGAKGAKG